MLPSSLFSTYRQYKQDTDEVVSWLAWTAKARGYPADLLSSHATRPKSTRLKGKERMQARSEGKLNASQATPKYPVPIKDMIPLAQFIAQCHNPFVSVPASFSTTLDRLITLRASFGQKLSDHGAEPDPESTKKHEHLVGVLEVVRDTLRPRMSCEPTHIPTQTAVSADGVKEVGNRFATLVVEEPSEVFINACLAASSGQIPKPQRGEDIMYEAEASTSRDEVLFLYTMMLNDLNRLRKYIEGLWINVRKGCLDLAACAVATDTAINLARGLIDEVAPLFKTFEGGIWHIANRLFLTLCSYQGFHHDQVYGFGEDNFNYDMYETANSAYMIAHRLLHTLARVVKPEKLALVLKKEDLLEDYDAGSDRFNKSGYQKFQEDQTVLMELFAELLTIIHTLPAYPVEDELLRGIKQLEKTSEIPFSLVFAAQIYLDIHHIMRADTAKCLSTLLHEVSMMRNSIRKQTEFLKHANWPAENDHILWCVSGVMDDMMDDLVYQSKRAVLANIGELMSPKVKPHRIMIHSPIICGLYLCSLRMKMKDIGVTIANTTGTILYCAHLYNALQCQDLLDREWSDMEAVLQLLGYDNFWVGGERPKIVEQCYRKLCLQTGMSAATFVPSNKRRNTTALISRAGARTIKKGTPVSQMFRSRLLTSTGASLNWTVEQIDDVISHSQHVLQESVEDKISIMTGLDDPPEPQQVKTARGKSQKVLWKSSASSKTNLSPGELVKTLALALNAEAMELGFPYLKMHVRCWKLLRSVNNACESILRSRHGRTYMRTEKELPSVVSHVLSVINSQGETANKRVVEGAAAALNGFLASKSSSLVSKIVLEDGVGMKFNKDLESNEDKKDVVPES